MTSRFLYGSLAVSLLSATPAAAALSPAEQTQLNNTIANNAGTEVFTTGATFANAQGGPETISALHLLGGVAAIPEAETYAMMLAGLGLLGFLAKRRAKLQ